MCRTHITYLCKCSSIPFHRMSRDYLLGGSMFSCLFSLLVMKLTTTGLTRAVFSPDMLLPRLDVACSVLYNTVWCRISCSGVILWLPVPPNNHEKDPCWTEAVLQQYNLPPHARCQCMSSLASLRNDHCQIGVATSLTGWSWRVF